MNVQTAIGRAFLLEIGYVGARGEHLASQVELNQATVASATNPVNGVTTNNTGPTDSAAARAPFIGLSNNGFLFLRTNTSSNFNSLQTTLSERLGTATFLISYMYSKSLDTASGTTDGTVFAGFSGDQTNPAQAYGPSDFDRTEHLTARFVQPLPDVKWRIARGPVGRRVLHGYSLSGTAILQSGTPFSITNAGGAAYYGTDTSRASYLPGATAAQAVKHGRTEDRLTSYFTNVFTGSGNFYGNTARNILRGPFQRDVDLSLTKYTTIRENLKLEFRAQAFNISNTPNFANPGSDEGTASTFGAITATTGNPRILQFAAKITY